jgi:hypothetical protein
MAAPPTIPSTHQLSEYLRSKSDGAPNAKKESCGPAGCMFPLGIGLIAFGLATEALWGMASGIGLIVVAIIVAASSTSKSALQEPTVLDEFVWLNGQRALATRIDWRALPLLEACAAARNRAIASLESAAWVDRSKDANWAQIRTSAIDAAEGAMLDALAAAREMVRTKGMKQVVYTARCADPSHGATALERLTNIKREMEELASRVRVELAAPEPEPSSIRRVLEDLQQVHEAQRELDEDVPRLTQ